MGDFKPGTSSIFVPSTLDSNGSIFNPGNDSDFEPDPTDDTEGDTDPIESDLLILTITNSDSPFDIDIFADYRFFLIDASAGNVVVNLPSPSKGGGEVLLLKRIDNSSNTVTIQVGTDVETEDSSDIDSDTTHTLSEINECMIVASDSDRWRIISFYDEFIDSEDITVSTLGDSTYSTLQHLMNFAMSPGRLEGGEISDAGGETIDVAAGKGLIKAVDSDTAELSFFDWNQSLGIAIPTDTVRYIGVEYNAGSPQVVSRSTNTWDLDTEFPLGEVTNEGGLLHILDNPWWTGDPIANIIERLQSQGNVVRDNREGGLILGETGTRNITVTPGILLSRLSEFPIPQIDTSGADTFTTQYRDGAGGWNITSGVTQWPNTQYDDGSGTLAEMTNNNYANLWFYLETDGDLVMLYPTAQFANAGQAESEQPPTEVPDRILETGLLIGRLIFKKGAATATAIEGAFDTVFSPALITDHGNLAGLADDDHPQYLKGVDEDTTPQLGGDLDGQGNDISNIGKLGIGVSSPSNILEVYEAGIVRISIDSGGNNSGFRLKESGVNKYSVASYNNGEFTIFDDVSGVSRLHIKSGNLGIGTTSPNSKLVVQDAISNAGTHPHTLLYNSSAGANDQIRLSLVRGADSGNSEINKGTVIFGINGRAGWADYENRDLTFWTGSGTSATQKVCIKPDGKLGIGNTSPGTLLDVSGALTIRKLSADPADPAEGSMVTWMSDGTGTGDDGDILRKITAGGVTKMVTVHDFSAL